MAYYFRVDPSIGVCNRFSTLEECMTPDGPYRVQYNKNPIGNIADFALIQRAVLDDCQRSHINARAVVKVVPRDDNERGHGQLDITYIKVGEPQIHHWAYTLPVLREGSRTYILLSKTRNAFATKRDMVDHCPAYELESARKASKRCMESLGNKEGKYTSLKSHKMCNYSDRTIDRVKGVLVQLTSDARLNANLYHKVDTSKPYTGRLDTHEVKIINDALKKLKFSPEYRKHFLGDA